MLLTSSSLLFWSLLLICIVLLFQVVSALVRRVVRVTSTATVIFAYERDDSQGLRNIGAYQPINEIIFRLFVHSVDCLSRSVSMCVRSFFLSFGWFCCHQRKNTFVSISAVIWATDDIHPICRSYNHFRYYLWNVQRMHIFMLCSTILLIQCLFGSPHFLGKRHFINTNSSSCEMHETGIK